MSYPSPYEERDARIWAAWCRHSGDTGERHCNYPSTHSYWKFVIEKEKQEKKQEEIERYEKSEKNHFTDYLVKKGYKAYRERIEKGNLISEEVVPSLEFSSMASGMNDIRYKKECKTAVWGLSEKDKPPTLLYPRPYELFRDDDMNKFLALYTHEEICKKLDL